MEQPDLHYSICFVIFRSCYRIRIWAFIGSDVKMVKTIEELTEDIKRLETKLDQEKLDRLRLQKEFLLHSNKHIDEGAHKF